MPNSINSRAIKLQNAFASSMSANKACALKDRNFVGGDQWSQEQKDERTDRTMVTLNSAPVAKRKVKALYTSEQAAIRVKPYVTNVEDSSMVSQAIIDQILNNSMSDYVMDAVFDDLLTQGLGFGYVTAEYADENSFAQTLCLKHIKKPESVFYDLNTMAEDLSDMRYCGWSSVLDRSVLLQYGYNVDDLSTVTNFPQVSGQTLGTVPAESIVLCSFFERVEEPTQLIEFLNPTSGAIQVDSIRNVLKKEEYFEMLVKVGYYDTLSARAAVKENEEPILTDRAFREETLYFTSLQINRSRPTIVKYVSESLLAGNCVVDSNIRELKYLPLVPMLGETYRVDDDLYFDSMFRWSKEASKVHNYLNSNLVERLSMQPMANFIALDEQIEGYENDFNTTNKVPRGVLKYKRVKNADGSSFTTAPKELTNEANVGSWSSSLEKSKSEVDNLTGLQETALGGSGKEVSAEAIEARASQSADTIKSFITSRHKATALLGKILENYVTYFLIDPFTVEKETLDGQVEEIAVNGSSKYQVSQMRFETKLDIGTDYSSQKRQANTSLLAIADKFPDYADVLIDKIIETSDYRGSSILLERIRTKAMQKKVEPPKEENKNERKESEV